MSSIESTEKPEITAPILESTRDLETAAKRFSDMVRWSYEHGTAGLSREAITNGTPVYLEDEVGKPSSA